jgi:hypothetical protein
MTRRSSGGDDVRVDSPDLARDYGLEVAALEPHPGGFQSECLVADCTWFVKVWRTHEPPTGLKAFSKLHVAGLPVPSPLPARTGELHSWWGGRPYAVFPFIQGHAASAGDWRVMARTLRRIHETGGIDLPRGSMDEPRIRELGGQLDHPWIAGRAGVVAENIGRLERAIARAAAKTVPLVVCHRDFLGQNILADALLARALRDMAAPVQTETDRPGVDSWGFRRIERLDGDLEMFRPFCGHQPR